eukprot:3835755-Prymnesium_polylepis.3
MFEAFSETKSRQTGRGEARRAKVQQAMRKSFAVPEGNRARRKSCPKEILRGEAVSGLILGRAETWAADLADDMSVSEIDPAGQLRVFGAKIVPEGDDYSHSQASNVYGQISPQSASNSRSSSRAPSRRPSRHQIPEFSGRRSLTLSPQLPKRQLVKRGSAPSIVQSHQDVVDWQRLMRECPDPELSTPARA